MMFMTRVCLVLLSCSMMSFQGASGGWTKNIFNFLTHLNGVYDNSHQLEIEGAHGFIQLRFINVVTPAIPEGPAVFAEWAYNGHIFNLVLCTFRESTDGVIYINTYNFTNIKRYKPGCYNLDDLSAVKPEDLQTQPGCQAAFQPNDEGVYVGSWAECSFAIKGQHPAYGETVRCDDVEVMVPVMSYELSTLTPYILQRQGGRYPLIGAPDTYTSTCDQE